MSDPMSHLIPVIHPAMAIAGRASPMDAMRRISAFGADGEFPLDLSKCQITPQNHDLWTPERTQALAMAYPDTQFRFHASVRLKATAGDPVPWFDGGRTLAHPEPAARYWRALGACNDVLGAPIYSYHAGLRESGQKLPELFGAHRRIEDLMGCAVAIEHHYPVARGRTWYLNCWRELDALLASGLHFVVDLSHLNIVVAREGRQDDLTTALLESPQCLEIHISGNDGMADQHVSLMTTHEDWWWPVIRSARVSAAIFTEGVLAA